MDLSKLPKLSDTKSQIPLDATAPVDPPPASTLPAAPDLQMSVADTWISIGVGAFILLFWPRFLQWGSSRIFHTHFDEFEDPPGSGNVVAYQSLPDFWSDLGPTLLGIVLIVDGLLLFTRKPGLILCAIALTLISTLFNLGWVIYSYSSYGLAPLSLLAVIFGGFILSRQWAVYKAIRAFSAAQSGS